ncbi:MAG: two-component system response regulator RpfG [Planctomycetota bacterium]|jgi:two-component system response regulator RpfG
MKDHPMVANVMVIDDQLTSRIILETIIRSIGDNIKVSSYDNAITALDVVASNPPDLITVDYKMPEMDGVEFTRRLREIPSCHDIPIIVITIIEEKAIMYQALEAGATDFLNKPVDHYECKVRCRNLLTMRRQQMIIKNRARSLETKIAEATEQIHIREKETLYRLARAGEFKDGATGLHLIQMAKISRLIAEELGMDSEFCDTIEVAAPMHDIGKIGIPDNILLKPEVLTSDEFEIMKGHSQIGYEILKDNPSPYLKMGALIALNHHEKFNGEGYPNKIQKQDIPIEARIVAVADVFDALTSQRPYKEAWNINDALKQIDEQKSIHFDPDCVKALQARSGELITEHDALQSNLPSK